MTLELEECMFQVKVIVGMVVEVVMDEEVEKDMRWQVPPTRWGNGGGHEDAGRVDGRGDAIMKN